MAMSEPDDLLECLAELEHEQWVAWSRAVAAEVAPQRRERWQAWWVPYEQLPEEIKEDDRLWARKVLALLDAHRPGNR
jgi:hypothetical protein